MATFPTLRTGAVAQYPLDYSTRFATQTVRFLDGSSQRYRISGSGLRRWQIRLDLLDESELAALIDFVDAQTSNTFQFADPLSGTIVASCVLSGDPFEAILEAEGRGRASLVIEEIR